MPLTYFFASYLSSLELSQAGSHFTTEGLNETGEQKWALKQKMCWLSLLVPSIFMHWEYFFGLEFGPLSAQPCGFALCVFC